MIDLPTPDAIFVSGARWRINAAACLPGAIEATMNELIAVLTTSNARVRNVGLENWWETDAFERWASAASQAVAFVVANFSREQQAHFLRRLIEIDDHVLRHLAVLSIAFCFTDLDRPDDAAIHAAAMRRQVPPPEPIVFTGRVGVLTIQDGGRSLSMELDNGDGEMFIRIQSWSDEKRHPTLDALRGRRIKVTVEVVDDQS